MPVQTNQRHADNNLRHGAGLILRQYIGRVERRYPKQKPCLLRRDDLTFSDKRKLSLEIIYDVGEVQC